MCRQVIPRYAYILSLFPFAVKIGVAIFGPFLKDL